MVRSLPARLLEGLLVLVLVALPVLGIAPAVLGHNGLGWVGGERYGQPVSTEVELNRPVELPGGPRLTDTERGSVDAATGGRPVEISGPWKAQASFLDPTLPQRLLVIAPPIVASVTGMLVALLLLRLLGTVRRGEPFVAANVRRLRLIAVAIAVGAMLAQLLGLQGRASLLTEPAIEPFVRLSFEISFAPFAAALLVAAVAEILAVGTALRREVEGLV
jgi:hypothetical protein